MHIIITARPESAAYALSELQHYDKGIRSVRDMGAGVKMIYLPGGYEQFLSDAPPLIFVRHMFPVQWQGEVPDCAKMLKSISLPDTNAGAFSVQLREAGPHEKTDREALVRTLETALREKGYAQDDKNPAWVLSLFAHENIWYAGASFCKDNRSAWNGGAMRFARTEAFISRAEFKLLEALEVFGLSPLPGANALDLGASPGGWSKVLLDRGCCVTALDPAPLDPRLAHKNLSYVCATAQRFIAAQPPDQPDAAFDWLVNDMRMEMFESVRIMLDAACLLVPGGTAIMTLKLAKGQGLSKINKALALVAQKYRVHSTRQLFHNRDEVTVYAISQLPL